MWGWGGGLSEVKSRGVAWIIWVVGMNSVEFKQPLMTECVLHVALSVIACIHRVGLPKAVFVLRDSLNANQEEQGRWHMMEILKYFSVSAN
jgi:hypothetical protein